LSSTISIFPAITVFPGLCPRSSLIFDYSRPAMGKERPKSPTPLPVACHQAAY